MAAGRISSVCRMVHRTVWAAVLGCAVSGEAQPRAQGAPAVQESGARSVWRTLTLTFRGPHASETGTPNPFLDYRLDVTFTHASGTTVRVPGYFAADGRAGESSATAGTAWRAHFVPDRPGRWTWRAAFVQGRDVAVAPSGGTPLPPIDGATGELTVGPPAGNGQDVHARGRLQYVGERYLRFAGSGEPFLKVGADSPETLLAYADFDGTVAAKVAVPLKTYAPHVGDWRPGDPTWKGGNGKGLVGALRYLAEQGVNAVSFLTYNRGGDGDNVWPFVSRDETLRYDVSKLDQWAIVFAHAQRLGLYLHVKLQETENDDQRRGDGRDGWKDTRPVPEALDGGVLGRERKLYLRELVARFGHALALNWNLGEENTQSTAEQVAMAAWLRDLDPYDHHIVLHTHPGQQRAIYMPLLGGASALTGVSIQTAFDNVHRETVEWIQRASDAGRPWVVANDEQGTANLGVPPDPGYKGFAGTDPSGAPIRTIHDIRRYTLWGNLMAGGAGVEYYFGYQLPENDLVAEDFRSRQRSWEYGRIAVEFFARERLPIRQMREADALVGNALHDNSQYAFAQPGEIYLVYLPQGGSSTLDLTGQRGAFTVQWFDPRAGGALQVGAVARVTGGATVDLGPPPREVHDDWLVVVRKAP